MCWKKGELDAVISLASDILVYAEAHNLQYIELVKIPKIFLFSASSEIGPSPAPVDFKDIPMLVISEKSVVNALQSNVDLCHKYGFQPHIVFKDSLDDVLFGVGLNEGFFICDARFEPLMLPHFRHLRLSDRHSVVLAWWKQNQNPALKPLIQCCTKAIQWPESL